MTVSTKAQRQRAREYLRVFFDQWESMTDEELLNCLRSCVRQDVTTKSRHQTIKWLVDYYVSTKMM